MRFRISIAKVGKWKPAQGVAGVQSNESAGPTGTTRVGLMVAWLA